MVGMRNDQQSTCVWLGFLVSVFIILVLGHLVESSPRAKYTVMVGIRIVLQWGESTRAHCIAEGRGGKQAAQDGKNEQRNGVDAAVDHSQCASRQTHKSLGGILPLSMDPANADAESELLLHDYPASFTFLPPRKDSTESSSSSA
jgi:hypothetical protein